MSVSEQLHTYPSANPPPPPQQQSTNNKLALMLDLGKGRYTVSEILSLRVYSNSFNPIHPDISMHILHTVLYTCPYVLARRSCLTIKRFFS